MDIKLYNDFLNLEQWQHAVRQTVQGKSWEFSGFSNTDKSEPKFWYMDLDNDAFFINTVFPKICDVTGKDFTLERVYANGQTHGLSGSLHQDQIDADNYYTLLYYPGPFWHPTWGGYTVFHNPTDDTIYSQYPTPNSAVLFNSKTFHAGLEPTRHCTDLRVTVAFKMKLATQ